AADIRRGRPVVAARRRDAASTREIRHVRVAISRLPPEGEELPRGVLEVEGGIALVHIESGALRKIRRSRDGIRPVDGREQRQIPAWISHEAATRRDGELIVVEPD